MINSEKDNKDFTELNISILCLLFLPGVRMIVEDALAFTNLTGFKNPLGLFIYIILHDAT
jgi:hypothetical protein